ncbi:MAG: resuscitation-promoting factor RpfB, partial [Patescibacteria group bacterium]|nr:resuscitation-promoting factor RpfB [Patescibacteria group bacterium]
MVFLFILSSISWSNDQFTTQNTAIADGQNLVSVYYDGQNKTVATSATTVGEALDKMGVQLQEGDVVEPSLDSGISRGVTNINVYRSFSYLVVDGEEKIATTSGYRSPKKVIEHAGIELYPEDIVSSDRVDEFIQDRSVGQRLIIQRATPVTVVLAGQVF